MSYINEILNMLSGCDNKNGFKMILKSKNLNSEFKAFHKCNKRKHIPIVKIRLNQGRYRGFCQLPLEVDEFVLELIQSKKRTIVILFECFHTFIRRQKIHFIMSEKHIINRLTCFLLKLSFNK